MFAAGPASAGKLARRAPSHTSGPRGGSGFGFAQGRPYPPGASSERETPWGPPPAYQPPPAQVVDALAGVYEEVEAGLGWAAEACRACGRCCRFRPGGIVLFASSLEMAALIAEAGPPDADRFVRGGVVAGKWICPYQAGNLCAARQVRPLGCRTYFCDADAGERGRALHADALHQVRAIARVHDYPWWYGPAKVYLDTLIGGGR